MFPWFPLVAMGVGAALLLSREEPEAYGAVVTGRSPPVRRMAGTVTLAPLPYSEDALSPWQSAETVRLHHDKLQAGYVKKTNAQLRELERLAHSSEDVRQRRFALTKSLVSNASGAFLHQLYWENLSPRRQPLPSGLGRLLSADFGSVKGFVRAFDDVALSIVGSGWAVLAYSPFLGRMVILPVSDHDQYLIPGSIPLLVCDVWEHAYYLDHPADRKAYVRGFWDHVNWGVVSRRLRGAVV